MSIPTSIRLLTRSSPVIQKLSIQCLVAWKVDYIIPYKDALIKLIPNDTFREELSLLNMDYHQESRSYEASEETGKGILIKEEHRIGFIQVLSRIFFGKMMQRKGSVNIQLEHINLHYYVISSSSSNLYHFLIVFL